MPRATAEVIRRLRRWAYSAAWGQTINEAANYVGPYPLYLWAPVIGVLLLVLSLNLLGDAIRDAFDPKTRR